MKYVTCLKMLFQIHWIFSKLSLVSCHNYVGDDKSIRWKDQFTCCRTPWIYKRFGQQLHVGNASQTNAIKAVVTKLLLRDLTFEKMTKTFAPSAKQK